MRLQTHLLSLSFILLVRVSYRLWVLLDWPVRRLHPLLAELFTRVWVLLDGALTRANVGGTTSRDGGRVDGGHNGDGGEGRELHCEGEDLG